jgi:ferredoxin
MAKKPNWKHRFRRVSQVFFLIALNPYFFMYRGFCVPAMNCWACPAAAFGCPVGAIGNFLVKGIVPFFTIGLMLLLGALIGRMICGWVCPFGLLQDLLAKVPVKKLPFPKVLSFGKYAFLLLTVFLIPIFFGIDKKPTGTHVSDFFFCNYCPAGTLEAAIPVRFFGSRLAGEAAALAGEAGGADQAGGGTFDDPDEELWGDGDESGGDDPMADGEDPAGGGGDDGGDLWGDDDDEPAGKDDWLSGGEDEGAADQAGLATAGAGDTFRFMTSTRMWVLYTFLLAFVFIRRPFCRGFCPIGAVFALLNRFSFFRMRVKVERCKGCDACGKKCPVDNRVYSYPGSDDCIRCLECMDNCPRHGVECGLVPVRKREEYWE